MVIMTNHGGKVFLVGAGPGDPGLLTVRGAECLARADVVLYDYLASPLLLRHTAPHAELVCLGRHGGRLMSQEEVSRLMVEHAAAGKLVVRLKGGDPGIFGRVAEEATGLNSAGIPFEIVPGITTAVAAGSYAGVTLTDRDHASCVAFVTGREQAGKDAADGLDYAALAKFPGTLVFYMGVTTAPHWSQALIDGGKPGDTPVAMVRCCSLPTQEQWTCRLDEVAKVLAPAKVRPPVVVIVGPVVAHEKLARWFTSRPLFGKTVLVTRAEHQADTMANRLEDLGAAVLRQPAIEITPPDDWTPVDTAIDELDEYDWLVFSSRNGVTHFLDRIREQGLDWRALGGVKLAAIGPATADALAERDLQVDLKPTEYRAEALAAELAPNARGQRFLLLRASRGREVLAETLREAGGVVDQVVVYNSADVTQSDSHTASLLADGKIDWITVTSSAIARSLVGMFGDALRKAKLAAISPLTAGVLDELGHSAAAVADEYTIDGVVDAILAARL